MKRPRAPFFVVPLGFLLPLVGLALTIQGCAGGSGSSGFDIRSSELAAIHHVLEENECVERQELVICPAGEGISFVPGSPTPAPSPGPANAPRIDTQLDHTTSVACGLIPGTDACHLSVPFLPSGFPPGSRFHVAIRPNQEGAKWTVNTDRASTDETGTFNTPLRIQTGGLEVQVAILVFPPPTGDIPTQVMDLAETKAGFAYVTHVLMLSPS